MKLTLSAIEKVVRGRLVGEDRLIDAVSIDTRSLQKGDLYVAIRGEHFDGHDFVEQAEQAGAGAVIVERQLETPLPQVVVADTRLALAEIGGAWRRRLSVKVAGVTGSNGKTTVKEMIAAILSLENKVLYTQGNLNNDIGVPLTLLRLREDDRYAVIEMGANHPGEIAYTSHYAQADVVVITNVGAAHIEGFGDLSGVASAKGEIIETLGDSGIAVLNRDDAFYPFWRELADSRKIVSFGLGKDADVRAEEIETRIEGHQFVTAFQLQSATQRRPMRMQLAGVHNVANALAAAAVCLQMGIDLSQIEAGLALMKPVAGRLQPLVGRKGNIIIDDSYNANPSSLKAALDVLLQCGGKPWLVMGAFGEVGPDSPRVHREIGELCKQMKIARLFAIGPDARHCVDGFGEGATYFTSHEAMIADLEQQLSGQETLLIKGSRARKMEQVAAALVENFRA